MISPPEGMKRISGFTDSGIDENGEWVFFGFNLENETPKTFEAHYQVLGAAINYLRQIATMAQQRRLNLDPTVADREVRETEPNFVTQLDLYPALGGTGVALECTTQDGTGVQAQLPLDLLEQMLQRLPDLIAEMKRRQDDRGRTH